MTSLTDRMESAALEVRKQLDPSGAPTPRSLLEREVAFFVEQLENARRMQQQHLTGILRAECYVSSDLSKLDCYLPRLYSYRFKARDNLKNKLLGLDKERRQLITQHHRDVAEVHEKLVRSLAQLSQLDW